MKFTFFHLMPYRPLDMAERHKHRAAWVVLPNTLYDPKKGADEYQPTSTSSSMPRSSASTSSASTSITRPPMG